MSEQNSGGSSQIAGDAFGFSGGGTATVQQQGSTPPKAENSHQNDGSEQVQSTQPNEAEELNVSSTEVQQPQTQAQENGKVFKKQAEDNRKMVIDMLEDKFMQLQDGRLKESDLKSWFVAHPELAETANRSKRVKDRYRELMEKPVTRSTSENVTIPDSQISSETSEELENKPLTQKDLAITLAKFNEEQEIKLATKLITKERQDFIEGFAEKHQVLDKDFTVLQRNADALFKANPEWDYSEAVRAAYATVNPSKGTPVQVPNTQMPAPEMVQSKVDASIPGGIQLMSSEEFSGGQIKNQ